MRQKDRGRGDRCPAEYRIGWLWRGGACRGRGDCLVYIGSGKLRERPAEDETVPLIKPEVITQVMDLVPKRVLVSGVVCGDCGGQCQNIIDQESLKGTKSFVSPL